MADEVREAIRHLPPLNCRFLGRLAGLAPPLEQHSKGEVAARLLGVLRGDTLFVARPLLHIPIQPFNRLGVSKVVPGVAALSGCCNVPDCRLQGRS
jgi:hypothetical protein